MNWKPFEKDKPETWPKGTVLWWTKRGGFGTGWVHRGALDYICFENGERYDLKGVTHYAEITNPTDTPSTVSVPRETLAGLVSFAETFPLEPSHAGACDGSGWCQECGGKGKVEEGDKKDE